MIVPLTGQSVAGKGRERVLTSLLGTCMSTVRAAHSESARAAKAAAERRRRGRRSCVRQRVLYAAGSRAILQRDCRIKRRTVGAKDVSSSLPPYRNGSRATQMADELCACMSCTVRVDRTVMQGPWCEHTGRARQIRGGLQQHRAACRMYSSISSSQSASVAT